MLETQKIPYALGIDVGSTTVKTVLLTEMGEVLSSSYERHFSKVRETVCTKLASLAQEYPDVQLRVSITGSAGLGLAQAAGLPFVQEVHAAFLAVKRRYPEADVVIELGGEDAKIIFLTGGVEQRMNGSRRYRCLYRPDGDSAGRERGSAGQNGTGSRKGVSHCFPLRRVRQV